MRLAHLALAALCSVSLTGCAGFSEDPAPQRPSIPPQTTPQPNAGQSVPPAPLPAPKPILSPPPIPSPAGPSPLPPSADGVPLRFAPSDFAALPDWRATDLGAARRAFVRSCALIQRRAPASALSANAAYGGKVADWALPCAQASNSQMADAEFWESQFGVWSVSTSAGPIGRLTAYYEPIMAARRTADALHSEPIQARPADLLDIDLGGFDPALRGRTAAGRLEGTRIVPYPPRAQITPDSAPILAWGEPGEVLSLQIQGSGRLVFEDGIQVRAAFAAHNGQKFGSSAQELIRRGYLPPNGASMEAVKAWFRTAEPGVRRDVLNANPRTVFFKLQPIADPNVGPLGGQGIALEPNGSMAVDTSYHPYGIPFFLTADAPRVALSEDKTLRRLVISQDTGGAIKGPIRGDLYWGTGPEAGLRAGRINHDTRFWVLLPKALNPNAAGASALATASAK